MTVQELNTLHTICELERTQLLTILAMSVKNPQLAGFLLTGNRSNFLYVEGSTAWLYDCPHFISHLYNADKCFDRIPIHYRETIMYVDPITRQTCWRQSSAGKESRFGTCWLRNKTQTLKNLDENLKKIQSSQFFKPPPNGFSPRLLTLEPRNLAHIRKYLTHTHTGQVSRSSTHYNPLYPSHV